MVDQILSQEDQEFEALVSSMRDNADQEDCSTQKTICDYGTDEEEYDRLFIEVMSRQGLAQGGIDAVGDGAAEQEHKMDMSSG